MYSCDDLDSTTRPLTPSCFSARWRPTNARWLNRGVFRPADVGDEADLERRAPLRGSVRMAAEPGRNEQDDERADDEQCLLHSHSGGTIGHRFSSQSLKPPE